MITTNRQKIYFKNFKMYRKKREKDREISQPENIEKQTQKKPGPRK